MVDLILCAAIFGAFYVGFKAGQKFRTLQELVAGAMTWLKS